MRKWLFILIMCILQPAYATEPPVVTNKLNHHKQPSSLDLYIDNAYYIPESNWVDAVTMIKIHPSALRIKYRGPRKLLYKQANHQARRMVRKYESKTEPRNRLDRWQVPNPNQWWSRSWLASMPISKGGASATYTHTVGKDIDWKFGPLTVSNTFKISLDYVAAFKLNTDPTTPEGNPKKAGVAVDISTKNIPTSSSITYFKFKVKPNISIGLLKSGNLLGFLRNVSLRVELDVVFRGKTIIQGEVGLRYRNKDGLKIEFSISLARW